jgi:hypothetical protein
LTEDQKVASFFQALSLELDGKGVCNAIGTPLGFKADSYLSKNDSTKLGSRFHRVIDGKLHNLSFSLIVKIIVHCSTDKNWVEDSQ